MLHLRPILSSLRRSPTGAILVALQIALALAVTVNSLDIITQRIERIGRDPGLDVPDIFVVSFSPLGKGFDAEPAMLGDLQLLRSLPGVVSATAVNSVPLSGGGSMTSIYTEPAEKGRKASINFFEVDEHGLDTFGTKLAEGRNFEPAVVHKRSRNSTEFVPEIVLSRPVANELFPGKDALGQTVYDPLGQPARVIGLLDNMHGSWPDSDKLDYTALVPVIPDEQQARYLVRAEPGRRDELMKLAEDRLNEIQNGRIVTRTRSLENIAAASYADDRAMAVYLTVVVVLLLAISALGVFGLASFNVSTRIKQIGTRRAVGARRADVIRHFLVENWLVTTVGVASGCVLALLLGWWLSTTFELPRLRLYYLVAGVFGLWVVGLASALVPARRAARVSPAVATRTV